MIWFILKKLTHGLGSIILIILVLSFILFYAPIDPVRMSFGQRSDEETINLFKQKYYLDKSLGIQIFHFFEDLSPLQWVKNNDLRLEDYKKQFIFKGEFSSLIIKKPYFRKSFANGRPAWDLLIEAFPSTLVLAISSILIAIILGLCLGFIASIHVNSIWDRLILAFCSISYSIPSYVSSLLVVVFFAYWLGDYTGLPIQGSLYEFNDEGDLRLELKNLILPVVALGIRPVSMIAQMTRVSCLDVLSSDFIRTARSKGITNIRLVQKHLIPNCINPILTTISSWFASLLAGSFFVEFVFNYKGLGLLTITSLNQFDIPLIMACCVMIVILFVIVNLITDFLYSFFDPRIKFYD
ncbi:MAG: ABC transporter permease [Saprospiraceae bacterium]|nr:ABC transporter permease [Saprospiraceae bacterium]